jgi:hypothetical protein
MVRRLPVLIGLCLLGGVAAVGARQDLTKADATSMARKLAAIIERGSPPATPPGKPGRALRTSFTDREVNAYFKFNPDLMPEGVTDPRVVIAEGGKVRAVAKVNLADALKTKERSWMLAWIGGLVEIAANGTLTTSNGMGTFALEKASFAGVPVPTSLLQQVVTHYSRSPELPEGFDLQKPFELPSRIRSVETRAGAATIVQ